MAKCSSSSSRLLFILLSIELLKCAELFFVVKIRIVSLLQKLNDLKIEPVRTATIPFRLKRLVGMRTQTQLKLRAIHCSMYVATRCN